MNFIRTIQPTLAALCVSSAIFAQEPAASPIPLTKVVDQILAQNPELKFYEAEIDAARANRELAGTWSDPEISLDVGRKRVREASGILAGEGTAWSVSLTQTFEWPGRLSLRKAIANRDLELAELGLARFRNALTARARSLAFGLAAANAQAEAVREVADRFTSLKETFLARDQAGIAPLLETRVIEASELALQRRASDAELTLQEALIELNQLRGEAPGAPLTVLPPTVILNEAPPVDALLAAAQENNFDFRMRLLELEQQGFAVQLARNERYPSISVSPFYSEERAGERESVVGIGLSVPLPVTGRTHRAVDVAEARRRQAEAAALVARLQLERDVLTAAKIFETKLAETRRSSADSVTKFREAAQLADRHYRLGAVPIATYVELQDSYLDAVEALLETQREALEAGLELQQLTGLDFNAVEVGP